MTTGRNLAPDLGFEKVVLTLSTQWVFKAWEEQNQTSLFLSQLCSVQAKLNGDAPVLQLLIKLLTIVLSLEGAGLPLRDGVKYH